MTSLSLPVLPLAGTDGTSASDLPRLERVGEAVRLIVDGAPYLALGGELHNSTSSDPAYLDRACARLAESGVTTIVATTSWDEVETTEGAFDFSSVSATLDVARRHGLRIVLIWFGAYKNARSTYAPTWVRADLDRFPRARVVPSETAAPFSYVGAMSKPELSVFSRELRAADAAAYAALLEHLRVEDAEHTVIMVQIENEVGLLGGGRDISPTAQAAWESDVPADVIETVLLHEEFAGSWLAERLTQSTGSWAEVFGEDNRSDELFMSWGFASYIEELAALGKAVLPLPTLVNAWLGPQPGQTQAGQYPSGGPTSAMIPVWESLAPSIDIIAPDIYVQDSEPVMREYSRGGRALLIPEARFRVADLFLALARYNGVGYCAFGVEDGRPGNQFFTASSLLTSQTEAVVHAQAAGRIRAVLLEGEEPQTFSFGEYTVTVHDTAALFTRVLLDAGVARPVSRPELELESSAGPFGPDPADDRAFGAILQVADDEFLLLGTGFTVDFAHSLDVVELDRVRELRQEDGDWIEGRLLNGDEHMRLVPTGEIGGSRVRLLRHRAQ
ncbi:glycoside hydrolase [Rathayibacter caricis DSM 15933]|jgi:beta-galactosidase GanA|uniref:Glycoside hydrolase n=1 Tax=Rathayibacter caricis DSM 15933 TaxID=1328867 RepID=A0A2T4UR35_9MICO|nr:DUF5597 domain-containing protein [Rathayibacter caricis]PTL71984.1 glycoside hydrolase [Rathayibacter caricis DSM 15933]